MKTTTKKRQDKGAAQIRKEKRAGVYRWGYDAWIRQEDGSRKRFKAFTFASRPEATEALAALRTTGWKKRMGISAPEPVIHTTIEMAIESYIKVAKAKLLSNRNEDSTYWREEPGHLKTLRRFGEFMGLKRRVDSLVKDDFEFWVSHETERGRLAKKPIQKASIKRGLNTIRAALNHAIENRPDLTVYRLPRSPLTKKVDKARDIVLPEEDIKKIAATLATKAEWAEALFFFQLDVQIGARMAELRRMKWEEIETRFGTVRLFSTKTGEWRTITTPNAANLIAERKKAGLGTPVRVLTKPDHWFREVFEEASKAAGVSYGTKTPGGWSPHDLRHTCLTNLALAGVPLNGIKDFAGHKSIVDTEKYLKFMPQSMDLAASVSTKLAALFGPTNSSTNKHPKTKAITKNGNHTATCPNCGHEIHLAKT